jgi:splicing factor 3B subunit 2
VWDVTASDPVFLIWLKSYRNSVPVSKHWSQKRKYLQYKRGVQKAPFNLPEYIEATGISRLRNTINNDPGKVNRL